VKEHVAVALAVDSDRPHLMAVWEASVRATHDFLSERDLQQLIPLARQEIARMSPIYCLRDGDGLAYAFMIVGNSEIEGLFVAPAHYGSGAGRTLVEYAIGELGARRVDVNEQNKLALGFYERMGFHTVGRSVVDQYGNPLPILHMELLTPPPA
jgi:putative acetyltransferase